MFGSLAGLLSELDVLLSFADLASSCPTPYTRPDITPSVIICSIHFLPLIYLLVLEKLYGMIFTLLAVIGRGRYYIRRE